MSEGWWPAGGCLNEVLGVLGTRTVICNNVQEGSKREGMLLLMYGTHRRIY